MQSYMNTTTHTVSWFFKRHQEEELELKAPFQRNPVWTDKQKSFLIDTILRGYPIPELYMQEYSDADGNECYTVVDGQQRLRACIEFIEGELSLDSNDSPDFADMVFDDLTEAERKKIFNYNFSVRMLPEMADTELREMFQRLNRNVVSLNSQELRHATYWGDFISSMEMIASQDYWTDMAVFTANDIRRMLDVEYVSELAIGIVHGAQNKKSTVEKWYQAYEKDFPERQEVEEKISRTAKEIIHIFSPLKKTRWVKKSDLYSLFLALAPLSGQMPFSRDGRSEIRTKLSAFSSEVDAYITDPESSDIRDNVKFYARAVERAASDIKNRKSRIAAIANEISEIVSLETP